MQSSISIGTALHHPSQVHSSCGYNGSPLSTLIYPPQTQILIAVIICLPCSKALYDSHPVELCLCSVSLIACYS